MLKKTEMFTKPLTRAPGYILINSFFLEIGGFHVTSSPPCWWTENKRSLISSLCLSTSICSFHHCYLCLPRLLENHLLARAISMIFHTCTHFKKIETYYCEVKLHVKSASFSTDNGQTSRFSFFTVFLTIKTLSQNISATLLQIPF